MIKLQTPIFDVSALAAGEQIFISGTIYTARDAAHKRLVDMIINGETPPFDFSGQAVYYAGPSPAKPGQIIGSIGPTTSGRMDAYSPFLIEKGLKYMIGKGERNEEVKDAILKHKGAYFAAVGGAAALMSKCVIEERVIAFEDLGCEAIRELRVERFPVFVAIV